jgi:tetratricopeptide (TPR) repeat protein
MILEAHQVSAETSLTPQEKSFFSRFLDWTVFGTVCLTVFLLPLWFLPQTLDVLELNKQTLLLILTSVGLLAWLGRAIFERSFTLSRSWLHLIVLLFGMGYLVICLLAPDQYLALAGNIGQMQWAFATVAACIVFYFLAANSVRTTTRLYDLVLVFLASSVLVGGYGLLQLLGVYLFEGVASVTATSVFNTIGSPQAFGVFMTVPLILGSSLLVLGCRDTVCLLGRGGTPSVAAKSLVWAAVVMSFATAIVVDFWVIWTTILFGTALLVLVSSVRSRTIHSRLSLLVPGLLCAVSIALLVWPTPIHLKIQGEVMPSANHSWEIAKKSLQDHPLTGVGPGAWIYAYSQYRAPLVNLSEYWTVRFDRGVSSFLTMVAMLGTVGISLWLMLIVSSVVKSLLHVLHEKEDDAWQAYLTVFAGWATVTFTAFIYNFSLVHHFVFWFLLALLASLVTRSWSVWDTENAPRLMTGLSMLFVILGVGALSTVWLTGQRWVADKNYSQAVTGFQAGAPITETIAKLEQAVALNKLNDAYLRNLSQAYLMQLSATYGAGQPDAAKQQVLRDLVIKTTQTADQTTALNPWNVDNWSNAAVVYQAIASFTPKADEAALHNFEEALKREPNNPIFYNEMGKLHILRADAYATTLSAKDEATRKTAQDNITHELDEAARLLNEALQVKPDYAPAVYNLAILYERQNRLKDAIVKFEEILRTNPKDVGVALQLAILYYRDGQKDKALNIFEQIIALEPNYSNARWYLATIYAERSRWDDAIAQVQKILELNPENEMAKTRLNELMAARTKANEPKPTPMPEPLKEEITGPGALNPVKK